MSAGVPRFLDAALAVNVNNASHWQDCSRIVESGDVVRLSVVLKARADQLYSPVYISNYLNLVVDGDTIAEARIQPWSFFSPDSLHIRWYLLRPANLDTVYRNYLLSMAGWAPIPYREYPITEWNNSSEVTLRSLSNYRQLFPGTMRLKAEIGYRDQYVSTPGLECRYRVQGRYYGGPDKTVLRIGVKGDTGRSFLDFLVMMRGIPNIENPGSWNGYWQDHQTTNWLGGNLNTLMIQAAWLAGRNLAAYQEKLPWPELNGYKLTQYIAHGLQLSGNYYIDKQGHRIRIDRYSFGPGDIIVSRRHTAVFYEDIGSTESGERAPEKGFLDCNDFVLEADGHSLRLARLGQLFSDPITLIRWKKRWK